MYNIKITDDSKFIDKVYDMFMNPDYKVTDDNVNPLRDIKESAEEETNKLNRIFKIIKTGLINIQEKYKSIPLAELKKEIVDTGQQTTLYRTLARELAVDRTGGNFILNIGDLMNVNLEIEEEIVDTMLDLIIIEHYLNPPEPIELDFGGGWPGGGQPPIDDGDDTEGPSPPKKSDKDEYENPQELDNDEDYTIDDSIECDICTKGFKAFVESEKNKGEDDGGAANTNSNPADDSSDGGGVGDGEVNDKKDDNSNNISGEVRHAKEMADCARMDLQLLKVILAICKIIKALMKILDPVYAIVTQVVELAALACGCWRNPANIGEIVQRLLQMAVAIVTNIVTMLLDKIWKMLGLQCLTEESMDLIQQIQDALRGVRSINSAIDETANAYAKTVGDSYKKTADIMKSFDDARKDFLKNRENDFSDVKELFNKDSFSRAQWGNPIINGVSDTTGNILSSFTNGVGSTSAAKDIRKWINTVETSMEQFKNMPGYFKEGGEIGKEWENFKSHCKDFLVNTHVGWDYDEKGNLSWDALGDTGAGEWSNIIKDWNNNDATANNRNFGGVMLNSFGILSYDTQQEKGMEGTLKKVKEVQDQNAANEGTGKSIPQITSDEEQAAADRAAEEMRQRTGPGN